MKMESDNYKNRDKIIAHQNPPKTSSKFIVQPHIIDQVLVKSYIAPLPLFVLISGNRLIASGGVNK